MIRSLLYVPAHSERFLAKAHERGADAIILDLEDAVPEDAKDQAREHLLETVKAVGRNGASVFVRINSGERVVEDAAAACRAGAATLYVPKVRRAEDIVELIAALDKVGAETGRPPITFVALLEDIGAVLDARVIVKAPRLLGLSVGGEDLALSLGAEPTPDVLRLPKLLVHYAAKEQGLLSFGLLQSTADYSDQAGVGAAAREAAQHGFDGATCVHPSLVPILNAAFSPSAAQRDWANRVLQRAAERDGAFEVDGRMVDAPVVARARAILGKS
ncbi:HpcH/HpaI aldolase/citrate lyase family protein [Devosia aurantiaca]|uniref:CoA ester lyase n=1 Tax=Devosia aurantiaca TaxID=2714858 RepID=A0A6M1SPN5_9HYPH|nr:CoA ester lyase [Devosia aurantiaca]NGP19178.1 CoA ester lyase [Devosia aurantiaca]